MYRCINSHLSDRLQVIEKSEDISSEPVSPDLPDLEFVKQASSFWKVWGYKLRAGIPRPTRLGDFRESWSFSEYYKCIHTHLENISKTFTHITILQNYIHTITIILPTHSLHIHHNNITNTFPLITITLLVHSHSSQ